MYFCEWTNTLSNKGELVQFVSSSIMYMNARINIKIMIVKSEKENSMKKIELSLNI